MVVQRLSILEVPKQTCSMSERSTASRRDSSILCVNAASE